MTEVPASFAQEQLWFIDEFHHGLAAHNVAHQVRLRGPLEVAALGRALDGLVARHEALRTRLVAGEDGRPVQVIDPPAPVRLELADHVGLGREAASALLREFASAEALRPFRLARDHMLRACLVRLAAAEHVLVIVAHRTVLDEWSAGVLLADLAALYRTEAAGGAAGPARPAAQFARYAAWERQHLQGSVRTALDEYWRGALAGFETSQFPADRPRPVLADHDGAVETTMIDRELLDGLEELSRQEATTLDVMLLAALQVLLHRYTGQTDVIIGTVSANRARPEFASLIGLLASTLPVRADLSGDPAFTDLLARVRRAAQAARDHQDLPFSQVVEALNVERDTGRFPIFQIGFACREPAGDIESAGVVFHRENVEVRASMYDISFLAEPRPGGLWLEATYTPALFDAATVRRLLGNLGVLLRGVVTDPSARLSQLPVLTADELRRELAEWNDTAARFPPVCIHQGFEAQAASRPDAIAAQFEGQRMSYAELNQQANRIARRLRGLGAGPETLVGVCMRTGLLRLAALLGVWKAGGGYVPLDPEVPAERLAFMMADTGMTVVVTDQASAGCLPAADNVTVLSLDAGQEQIRALDSTDLDSTDLTDSGVTPANVAYVIYTSGSTGRPKGVVVEHRQAINFLQGMAGPWRIGPSTVLLAFAAFTFDVSVMDMFMPLLAGGRVVLAPAGTLHSPPRLAALIRDAGVTFACLPPAVLTLLRGEGFPDLRILLSAGEELSSDLLRAWMRDGLEIYNGYGPTEASIGATFMKLEPGTPLPPPIGRPKPNYQAYVLDAHLNPVAVGVTGELHIGGTGVARGYLGRPELTSERFIPDPFRPGPGARLYKTGDLVRRRADGTIVFAGRIDNQVKIRGLRVELGEIETALTAQPAIAQAVVIVAADPAGSQQLVGYLRAADGAAPEIADVREHLARSLPGYMIPAYLMLLDELPLTAHGKIDKAALPAPQGISAGAERVPPRTLIETILVDLYATVLGHEQIGATDSFFDAGGNSLQAMQLITKLRSTLAVDLDISDVFLTPTPQQLAGLLRGKHGFEDSDLGPDGIAGLPASAAASPASVA
ncbi:MAG TPA: amino acid adenylation domain-containing protein [Streptosporangiaceae bacterium]|jgi:amino acid adenylation domain-containing protein